MEKALTGMWYIANGMNRLIIVILAAATIFFGYKYFSLPNVADINVKWEQNTGLLTNAEKEKWLTREQEDSGAYIQVNTLVLVDSDTGEADLMLINPKYSACNLKITIKVEETSKLLYESPTLSPGTVIEKARIDTGLLKNKKENAIVHYVFYDGSNNILMERDVEVVLEIAD